METVFSLMMGVVGRLIEPNPVEVSYDDIQ
jgi:hypothetical protein